MGHPIWFKAPGRDELTHPALVGRTFWGRLTHDTHAHKHMNALLLAHTDSRCHTSHL